MGSPPSRRISKSGRRPSQPPDPGRGVSQPAHGSLQPGRGRAHDRGVQPDARHRGKGDAVGDGQVDPPLVLAEADGQRGTERRRYAQCRRHQVRRAARHDRQRDLAAGQGLRTGTDRAVAAHREYQLRTGRDRLPRDAVTGVGQPRLQQLHLPAASGRGRHGPAMQVRDVPDPLPVDDKRGGRHHRARSSRSGERCSDRQRDGSAPRPRDNGPRTEPGRGQRPITT